MASSMFFRVLVIYIAVSVTILFPIMISNQHRNCQDREEFSSVLNKRADSERLVISYAISGRENLLESLSDQAKRRFYREIGNLTVALHNIKDTNAQSCLLFK